jgi:ubiquinone/menaquinone biosynthesis C-methylase UbiE
MSRSEGFEELYRESAEPYGYSHRAIEVLRHRFVVDKVRHLAPRPVQILDVGCSLGQLTCQLGPISETTVAMDVSPTAVRKARGRCESSGGRYRYAVGSAVALPFDDQLFDLVVLCDGLVGWNLSPQQRAAALGEAHRVVRPGGYVLLTEFLRPRRFAGFIGEVEEGPLEIVAIEYLYDRFWYQLETWLRRFRRWRWVQLLFQSLPFARALQSGARLVGVHGAKHICVVTRRGS